MKTIYPLFIGLDELDNFPLSDGSRTVFTDEYAEMLVAEYINIEGRTYYPSASKGGNASYIPNLYPDTFNLIEKTMN